MFNDIFFHFHCQLLPIVIVCEAQWVIYEELPVIYSFPQISGELCYVSEILYIVTSEEYVSLFELGVCGYRSLFFYES